MNKYILILLILTLTGCKSLSYKETIETPLGGLNVNSNSFKNGSVNSFELGGLKIVK